MHFSAADAGAIRPVSATASTMPMRFMLSSKSFG
jgi:hypothetical protein